MKFEAVTHSGPISSAKSYISLGEGAVKSYHNKEKDPRPAPSPTFILLGQKSKTYYICNFETFFPKTFSNSKAMSLILSNFG